MHMGWVGEGGAVEEGKTIGCSDLVISRLADWQELHREGSIVPPARKMLILVPLVKF